MKKMQGKAQEAVGRVRETAGNASGRDGLRAKGKAERGEARAKLAAQYTKDAPAQRLKGKQTGRPFIAASRSEA
ncbi:CsbD family protein [Streptomyces sp. CB01201]|uniref:CsbD family protein n=1 Tax=Streptomyces sp. CB01201 TaxID=2020324 RepID=UPI000C27544C|nr:CsbD family protein [Streptomyces sp. CB01201]PJM97981.1 CsbD family protein [Streptomyces sp. CB01201]